MHLTQIVKQDRAGTMANICALYHGMHDQRIQWYIKLMSLLIIAYVVSPVDLIPDFIPVFGLLDEVILVPLAVAGIVKMIPGEIYNELVVIEQGKIIDKKIIYLGGILVATVWISVTLTTFILLN